MHEAMCRHADHVIQLKLLIPSAHFPTELDQYREVIYEFSFKTCQTKCYNLLKDPEIASMA